MTARAMMYLHTATPLHVGTGQSLDVIDLPIQRERNTDLPTMAGSGVKGVLRAECEGSAGSEGFVNSAFGNERSPEAGAGAVTFTDARLLLFPVRSVRLLFAWVTSPYLLRRYVADRIDTGLDVACELEAIAKIASAMPKGACAHKDLLLDPRADGGGTSGTVFIEDADLPAVVVPAVTSLAAALADRCLPESLRPLLQSRLLVVDDTTLGTLTRQCTEIAARVSIDNDTKTATGKALWYEESLPAETILYSTVFAENTRGEGAHRFTGEQHLDQLRKTGSAQFGGKASVGRGLCHVMWEPAR